MRVHIRERGFALPTVVLASLILTMVLASALSIASSTGVALREQYNNQVGREAAEAGLAYASSCYFNFSKLASSTQWPNAGMLETGEDCYGAYPSGVTCDRAAGAAPASCYVVSNSGTRTYFEVTYSPEPNFPTTMRFSAKGYVQRVAASTNTPTSTVAVSMEKSFSMDLFGVASGNDTTCSITSGKLYCWGLNNYGQVGNGTKTNVLTPTLIQGELAGKYVYAVSTGVSHTCAIAGTTREPAPSTGGVYCWGTNALLQYGSTMTAATAPVLVYTPGTAYGVAISARDRTCAILVKNTDAADRREYCWGENNQLQAGEKSDGTTPNPKPISGWAAVKDDSVSAAMTDVMSINNITNGSSCGIRSSGKAFCFGNGSQGALGDGTTSGDSARARMVKTNSSTFLTNVTKIATNNGRVCAISSGQLYCWGANWYVGVPIDWRLDSGPSFAAKGEIPYATPLITSASTHYSKVVTDFAIADWNTCFVSSAKVYCSGYNDKGQLGQGTISGPAGGDATAASQVVSANNAVEVKGALEGKTVVSLEGANYHFCAITSAKEVYCWGGNAYGQLGDGTTTDRPSPVRSQLPRDIIF